jgi:hypothetical protein
MLSAVVQFLAAARVDPRKQSFPVAKLIDATALFSHL